MRKTASRLSLALGLALLGGACSGGGHSGSFSGSTTNNNTTTDPHVTAALALINQSRASVGSAPVQLDAALTACALRHAQDLAGCANFSIGGFSGCAHKDFNSGDTCGAGSENQGIATGITSATIDNGFATVHDQMMAEGPPPPGSFNHYSNIVDPTRTAVGIGLFLDQNGDLWISEEFR